MHYEFAFESYQYFKEHTDSYDFEFIKNWITEPEFINYAQNNGLEKTKSICESIKTAKSSRYVRATDKQKSAIAYDLLTNMDAKTILIAIYGDSINKLFNEETDRGINIEISDKRIAFGYLNTWICKAGDDAKGNTYRASIAAIKHFSSNPEDDFCVAVIDGELIAVTEKELKSLGQEDHNVKWFSQ